MKKKTVSGIMLTLLLMGTLTLAFNIRPVRASGTVYIRPDGMVEGTEKIQRDGDVYTFTDNIYDEIVVEIDNVVVDGAGYTLQGTGSGNGIDLTGRSDISVKNVEIAAFKFGIHLHQSSNVSISGNNIIENDYGIYLGYSLYQVIFGNNITSNRIGIWLAISSNYTTISGNYITGDSSGVSIQISSDNNVSGNTIVANGEGIAISHDESNSISGNTIIARKYGIRLGYSSSNNVCGNNITITTDGGFAIKLARSSNNIIIGNTLVSRIGIGLSDNSDSNIITGNTVTASKNVTYPYPSTSEGITLHWSSHNTITENNITNNDYGIYLDSLSSDNKFYHNNFINNTNSAHGWSTGAVNVWDDGYPSGGNYWSDYTGEDANGDGIGDTPYVIDEDNQDNYPLMSPWSPKAPAVVPFWMQWWFWAIVTAGIVVSVGAVYFFKKRKPPTPTAPLSFRRHRYTRVKYPTLMFLSNFY